MRTIIAGSRHMNSLSLVAVAIESSGFADEISEVVCGMASGVDTCGMIWASDMNIPVKLFPADWKEYGKAAGPIRNAQMADYADALILVWDGKSPGSKNMLEIAEKKGLRIYQHTISAFV